MGGQGGFFKYLGQAFLYHWNLLAVGAGAALSILSGRADVALPLLGAVEMLFLVTLATRPRFQEAMDARELKERAPEQPQISDRQVKEILGALKDEDRRRFEKLKDLCREMGRLSQQMGRGAGPEGVSEMHLEGLNRLLWIYLRLLATSNALERYFRTTSLEELTEKMKEAQEKLSALGPPEEDDPNEVKHRRSLEDTVQTCSQRIENFKAVKDNYDFLGLEQERLYAKIAHLAEMGMNRQDPDYLSSEIDVVSGSVQKTEQTLGELDLLTHLSVQDAQPPNLFQSRKKTVAVSGS
ncbi:MAG: hypothetical protein AB1896_09880 [Thermodesulfobacteriota bacterium]